MIPRLRNVPERVSRADIGRGEGFGSAGRWNTAWESPAFFGIPEGSSVFLWGSVLPFGESIIAQGRDFVFRFPMQFPRDGENIFHAGKSRILWIFPGFRNQTAGRLGQKKLPPVSQAGGRFFHFLFSAERNAPFPRFAAAKKTAYNLAR